MHIIVCIKQVPETGEVRIDPERHTLVRTEVKGIINPFDLHAIEAALQLREKYGGKVTCISMGPEQTKEVLREAYALGVDDAVLLTHPSFAGADTLATSFTLSIGIKKVGGWDLILCGKQAIDGDTAQVGPELAEFLQIPSITCVRKIEIEGSSIIVERDVEDGFELLESTLPVLLTVTKEINQPRLPSLRGILSSKSKKITSWGLEELQIDQRLVGLSGSPTQVVHVFTPPKRERGERLEGETPEVVRELIRRLKEDKVISF
jgi:electron transfer flavoprotein beta subunit